MFCVFCGCLTKSMIRTVQSWFSFALAHTQRICTTYSPCFGFFLNRRPRHHLVVYVIFGCFVRLLFWFLVQKGSFVQYQMEAGWGTIGPEILNAATPISLPGLSMSSWKHFGGQTGASWDACWAQATKIPNRLFSNAPRNAYTPKLLPLCSCSYIFDHFNSRWA
jgi:hypothetical protein